MGLISSAIWYIGFFTIATLVAVFTDAVVTEAIGKFKAFCRKNKKIQRWLAK